MTNSWVDIGWADDRPTDEQLEESRQRIGFRQVPITAPGLLTYHDVYRTLITHGAVYLAGFDVVNDDSVAAWFLCRNRDTEYPLADLLLRSPAFAAAMPEVVEPGLTESTGFEFETSLVLDGRLAMALQWGGPYKSFEGTAKQAKALGAAFCDDLFGDRYDEIRVDHSTARWSKWFKGGVWDDTWVITDKGRHHLTVLCVTDVD